MAEDAGLSINSRLRSLPRDFGLIDLKPVTRRSESLLGRVALAVYKTMPPPKVCPPDYFYKTMPPPVY